MINRTRSHLRVLTGGVVAGVVVVVVVVVGMLALACDSRETPPPQAPEPTRTTPAPLPIVRVTLRAQGFESGTPIERDSSGLVLVHLEAGLADLSGVVPSVDEAPIMPGLHQPVRLDERAWSISVATRVADDVLAIRATACDQAEQCSTFERAAPVAEPAPALGALLGDIATALARPTSDQAAPQWSTPQSRDPYAVRLLGRAASVVYGLAPAPETNLGNVRRDPVARAVFLDPSMPLGQWLIARRDLAAGRAFAAFDALSMALQRDPSSVALLAASADALAQLSRADEAAQVWAELDRLLPRDARFIVPRVKAELAAGRAAQAAQRIAALPPTFYSDPNISALRVDLADHGAVADPGGDIDALLAVWQDADPRAVEPVRRRIARRLDSGDVDGADRMLTELDARADREVAARMHIAVAVARADWQRAIEIAARLDDRAMQRALRARAARASGVLDPRAADATDPHELVLYADTALQRGDARTALTYADRALERNDSLPDALIVRWSALTRLDRTSAADKTLARLRIVDPRSARELAKTPAHGGSPQTQGPSTAPGNTGLGAQPQPLSP